MEEDGSADDSIIYDDSGNQEDVNVSNLLYIGGFVSQWEAVLDTVDYLPNAVNPDRGKMLCDLLGSSEQIVSELEGVCDPNMLKAQVAEGKDVDKLDLEEVMPASRSHRLSTLQFRLDNQIKHKAMHSVTLTRGRFRANRNTWSMEYSHLLDGKKPQQPITEPVTVLEVTVFKPHLASGKARDSRVKIMFDRELLVLSTQRLKDLKAMIPCVVDEVVISEECSEYPDIGDNLKVKNMFKSSYFFIENVFYVDTVGEGKKDLSEPIRKWAAQHEGKAGVAADMQAKPIEDVILQDLSIRLGHPYLYCHAGDCEHVFMFSDLRLMHDADDKDLTTYPKLINKCAARRAVCIGCNIYTANWLTREDYFAPSDPAFFCDKCFRMMHYDKDGKKLGSFKAWPYTDVAVYT